jgi:hypothetical protein
MAERSPDEIVSASKELVQKAVDEWGEPDLIIESAEATFSGMPDLDADPDARALVQRVQDAVDRLPDGRGESPEPEPAAAEASDSEHAAPASS